MSGCMRLTMELFVCFYLLCIMLNYHAGCICGRGCSRARRSGGNIRERSVVWHRSCRISLMKAREVREGGDDGGVRFGRRVAKLFVFFFFKQKTAYEI